MHSTDVLRTETDDGRPHSGTNGRLRAVTTGATGGFVATCVMTAYRLPVSRSLPPTDEFWSQVIRRDGGGRSVVPALVLHLLYGTVGGVVYVLPVSGLAETTESRAELRGVVSAVVYSLLLSVFGKKVLLEALLGERLDPDETLVFHLGHVVYGIALGTWVGSRRSP